MATPNRQKKQLESTSLLAMHVKKPWRAAEFPISTGPTSTSTLYIFNKRTGGRVTSQANSKLLIETLTGQRGARVPFWYMRQAGRYLPEYREVRMRLGGFWDLVFNPEMAAEVTLQPVRRFQLDAAIIFSDILTIPFALGQNVTFLEKQGPVLDSLDYQKQDLGLSRRKIDDVLASIFETVRLTKKNLPKDVALIGFAGSPWTVATYMVEGKGTPGKEKTKAFFKGNSEQGRFLIETLVEATVFYLERQITAGAEAVQLFDSWAGALKGNELASLCLEPTRKIVARIKKKHPGIPVIGYPKGIGDETKAYFSKTGIDAIGIDQTVDPAWAAEHLQPLGCVQGNLDPALVAEGGTPMLDAAEKILRALTKGAHVFNLGHGI
ncbi:MAG TPA: uroporphyrinogen decarboxylase, partial [Sphingomonadales bacterium]|nr:uroporphyrinogen decarboxylase [Sphingomonadales bacterium]